MKPKTITVLSASGKELAPVTTKRAQKWLSTGRAILLEDQPQTIVLQQIVEVPRPSDWEQALRVLLARAEEESMRVVFSGDRILLEDEPEYLDEPNIDVPATLEGINGALQWLEGDVHEDDEEDEA